MAHYPPTDFKWRHFQEKQLYNVSVGIANMA